MRRDARGQAEKAQQRMEDAILAATQRVRQEAESAALAAVRRQAEREAALSKRTARAEACVAHTAFVRNVAARVR